MTAGADDPTRALGRVREIDKEEQIAFIDLPNGSILPYLMNDEDELYVNEVVFIGPNLNNIEQAPSTLWPRTPWIGNVRSVLEDLVIVGINGQLRSFPLPENVTLKAGFTVEGNDVDGVLRVLTERSISPLDLTLGEPFDISRWRENPDGSLSYDDFGGYAQIKARTKELIEVPLQRRDALLKIRAKAIKGVLFTGPSGTGKTMLGRIIAHQANAEFYKISGPEIISKYLGQSEEILREIFDDAKRQERAIIFFDEIDSVAPQRADDSHEASRRLVAQLLTKLDGFDQHDNIIVIATTNRPQDIDTALRRPGRFDWEIHFDYPNMADREEILRTIAANLNAADDLDHARIAEVTAGWSSADLRAIWSEAALLAVIDDRDMVLMEDYLGGFQRVDQQKSLILSTRRNKSRNGDN
ncbi:ATP-binding protein [Amycolatopsis methanolica]|uniref:ATP-binding protein n=1 Tax=Amycolatopsis methanolica TaxID=1814 RepID=UPI0012E0960C|nr:AAA family ATPase [Amycolatopsis methanolica]